MKRSPFLLTALLFSLLCGTASANAPLPTGKRHLDAEKKMPTLARPQTPENERQAEYEAEIHWQQDSLFPGTEQDFPGVHRPFPGEERPLPGEGPPGEADARLPETAPPRALPH